MNRVILHCDFNNFYASVECKTNPELKGLAVAVAGNVDERTGVILAKNNIAKQFNVKTGETIWQAKQKCPNLITVLPHFKKYLDYSKKAREIYIRYTDRVENFGIDECWLDISDSLNIFGSAYRIANDIRVTVKKEMGITISVGISFNKIFAKLGSDMKKPDAITVIDKEHFKEKLWCLPINNLLGVGRATEQLLNNAGIYSIGDIALSDWRYLENIIGKNGINLWRYANGLDESSVIHQDFIYEMKSLGNSTTCIKDLTDSFDVWRVILCLSEKVSYRLCESKKQTSTIVLGIKTSNLRYSEHSIQLEKPSCMVDEISSAAMKLYLSVKDQYDFIRAVGVRAIELSEEKYGIQMSIFSDKIEEKVIQKNIYKIQKKHGNSGITKAALLLDKNIPSISNNKELKLPVFR